METCPGLEFNIISLKYIHCLFLTRVFSRSLLLRAASLRRVTTAKRKGNNDKQACPVTLRLQLFSQSRITDRPV